MPRSILYVHGISKIGGSERDLLCLLERIDRQEWDPIVVCPPDGPLLGEVEKLKVRAYPMKLPSWRKFKGLLGIPFAVWSLIKLIRRCQVELVHVNDYWWGPPVYMASSMAQIPCVVHIRQEIEPCRVRQYWLKKPSRLFAMSQQIKDIAVGYGVDPGRVRVVYTGIDTAVTVSPAEIKRVRDCYGLSLHQPVIGTVANLFPRKGYEYLIEALADIQQVIPHIHCLIIGEGDDRYRNRLLEMVEEKKLKENVTFTGFQQNVLAYISAMDVFVLPSIMEGFGIVLLEAMSMGKPIVATTVGGIPEVVEDRVTGFLVPPKNSSALAQRIIDLLEDPQIREKLGLAGRARALERFSVNHMIIQIQRLYEELI